MSVVTVRDIEEGESAFAVVGGHEAGGVGEDRRAVDADDAAAHDIGAVPGAAGGTAPDVVVIGGDGVDAGGQVGDDEADGPAIGERLVHGDGVVFPMRPAAVLGQPPADGGVTARGVAVFIRVIGVEIIGGVGDGRISHGDRAGDDEADVGGQGQAAAGVVGVNEIGEGAGDGLLGAGEVGGHIPRGESRLGDIRSHGAIDVNAQELGGRVTGRQQDGENAKKTIQHGHNKMGDTS